jgi:uncharacterized protein (DUF433 family)
MRTPEYLERGQHELAIAVRTRTVTDQEPPVSKALHEEDISWTTLIKSGSTQTLHAAWFADSIFYAQRALGESVEIDSRRRGGVPVLKGTRFTVAQTLAELAESGGVNEVANRCMLDRELIRRLLYGLAAAVDRPYRR